MTLFINYLKLGHFFHFLELQGTLLIFLKQIIVIQCITKLCFYSSLQRYKE